MYNMDFEATRTKKKTKKKIKKISAEEFERLFDEGKEDILKYCDVKNIKVFDPKKQKLKDFIKAL